MSLIELVRGIQTSDETFEATQRLALHLGKTTCVSLVGQGREGAPRCAVLCSCSSMLLAPCLAGPATAGDAV